MIEGSLSQGEVADATDRINDGVMKKIERERNPAQKGDGRMLQNLPQGQRERRNANDQGGREGRKQFGNPWGDMRR